MRTYPVKSFAGNDVPAAAVEPWGLAGDRRWALVDDAGKNVNARKVHHLLGLRAEIVDAGSVRILDRAGESITVTAPADAEPRLAIPAPVAREGTNRLFAAFERRRLDRRARSP